MWQNLFKSPMQIADEFWFRIKIDLLIFRISASPTNVIHSDVTQKGYKSNDGAYIIRLASSQILYGCISSTPHSNKLKLILQFCTLYLVMQLISQLEMNRCTIASNCVKSCFNIPTSYERTCTRVNIFFTQVCRFLNGMLASRRLDLIILSAYDSLFFFHRFQLLSFISSRFTGQMFYLLVVPFSINMKPCCT